MEKQRVFFDFALPLTIGTISTKDRPLLIFHDHPMIMIVLKGNICINHNCKKTYCKENDIFLLGSNLPTLISGTEDSLIFTMIFDINHFRELFPALPVALFSENAIRNKPKLVSDVLTLALEISNNDSYNYKGLISKCNNLLSYMLNECQVFSNTLAKNSKGEKQYAQYSFLMQKLLAFIEANHFTDISLDVFAKEQHLSTNYLSHLIKNLSGKSFREILSFIRCCKSQQYLLDSDYRINEISYDVGFSQPTYYKKNFYNFFGTFPNEFRNTFGQTAFEELNIISDHERLLSLVKNFAFENNINLTQVAGVIYSVDYIDVNKSLYKYENLLSDMGKIRNIRSEMNEKTHRTFDNMHKDFRMQVITIGADPSLKGNIDSSFLPIAKNINLLINSGFTVAIEVTSTSNELIDTLTKFLLFYSRLFYDNIMFIKIMFKTKQNVKYQKNVEEEISQRIFDVVGVRLDVFTSSEYTNVISYIPELYDSYIITPFAMDELFHPENWPKEIDFSLIDEVNADGRVLCGGDGLLTWNGIKKPWWYSYMFVSKLRGDVIHHGKDHIVTNNNGRIAILTYNLCQKTPDFLTHITDYNKLNKISKNNEYTREHSFQITGIEGRYRITSHSLGKNACLFSKWMDLDYTPCLTEEEEDIITRICHPNVTFDTVDINGTFNITTIENSFGVSFSVLEKV